MSRSAARRLLAALVTALVVVLGCVPAALASAAHGYDAIVESSASEPASIGSMAATARLIGLPHWGRTDPSATGFTYDERPDARVDIQEVKVVEAASPLVNGPKEASAELSVEARRTSTTPLAADIATNTADDLAVAVSRPAGVADDFVSQAANNGRGTVWRPPGSTGNAGTVRIMEPTAQYPNGYVRFYNEGGQPIGLNGNPGPRSVTHIPLNPDGTYPIPKGWGAG